MEYRVCWLCGRNGSDDRLEMHHAFPGALRKKADKYGLTVFLCGERCHRNGPRAAHKCAETMISIKKDCQKRAMEEQGWSVSDFIREFGRNYLDEEEEAPVMSMGGFAIDEDDDDGLLIFG